MELCVAFVQVKPHVASLERAATTTYRQGGGACGESGTTVAGNGVVVQVRPGGILR